MNEEHLLDQLRELATYLELNGANPFKVRAFRKAVGVLEDVSDLPGVISARTLEELPGVGSGIAEQIYAWAEHGALPDLQTLQESIPASLLALTALPGLGSKKIRQLWQERGITTLAALETACADGSLGELKGFGDKVVQKILQGIATLQAAEGQWFYVEAYPVAAALCEMLATHDDVSQVQLVGALRRHVPLVRCIEIVMVTSDEPAIHALLASYDSRIPVEVHFANSETFVRMVFERSAEPAHLTECLGERTLDWAQCANEAQVYHACDLPFIAPELREGRGEVAAARANELPELVVSEDVQGILHCHTTWSDGKHGLEEMAEASRSHGFTYLGVSDHSRSAAYAGGLSVERVHAQHEAIDALNAQYDDFRILKGIECDILRDGSLDYDDETLACFDYVIASVHGQFQLPQDEMTARVCRALRHPAVRILAHPTGRLLLKREGYAIDIDEVLRVAGAEGVAVEINCAPKRSELDWTLGDLARKHGVRTVISPDAHSADAIDYYQYGVGLARKGGWSASDVINAWPTERMNQWLAN